VRLALPRKVKASVIGSPLVCAIDVAKWAMAVYRVGFVFERTVTEVPYLSAVTDLSA
jgi:hypothetical protein